MGMGISFFSSLKAVGQEGIIKGDNEDFMTWNGDVYMFNAFVVVSIGVLSPFLHNIVLTNWLTVFL